MTSETKNEIDWEKYNEEIRSDIVAPQTSFQHLIEILTENFLPREKSIVFLRQKDFFGFGENKTYIEIGENFDVSNSRAREIALKTKRKLQRNITRLLQKSKEPRVIIKEVEVFNLDRNGNALTVRSPIYELDELPVRIINCLANENIRTLDELLSKDEGYFCSIPNFGKRSLNELKEILLRHGLKLGMKIV